MAEHFFSPKIQARLWRSASPAVFKLGMVQTAWDAAFSPSGQALPSAVTSAMSWGVTTTMPVLVSTALSFLSKSPYIAAGLPAAAAAGAWFVADYLSSGLNRKIRQFGQFQRSVRKFQYGLGVSNGDLIDDMTRAARYDLASAISRRQQFFGREALFFHR